jgi:pyrimidine-nucleoside phosphorylase
VRETIELIRSKRYGEALSTDALRRFIRGYTAGEIPDYQASALLMAIVWRGLSPAELDAWTDAMLHSGELLDLTELPGRKVDKHSTGGVGDKLSLCLFPLVAACGVQVPSMSGRGLGHTGGTLDKLQAIPGFRIALTPDEVRAVLAKTGCCLFGQTEAVAPADRKLYALRDATGTVESIPLIASSIMSKKLAEGIDGLVLDVKVGAGAFMKTLDDARALARTLIELGQRANKQVVALLTDMSQPLGRAIGNAVEVAEAIAILGGRGPEDVWQLTRALGAHMLVLGHVAATVAEGGEKMDAARLSGAGLRAFEQIIAAQGGDSRVVAEPGRLPQARERQGVAAPSSGIVMGLDAERIGLAAMALGAGRARQEDPVDPAVGVELHVKRGQWIEAGTSLATLHVNDPSRAAAAHRLILDAYRITPRAATITPTGTTPISLAPPHLGSGGNPAGQPPTAGATHTSALGQGLILEVLGEAPGDPRGEAAP